PGGSLTQHQPFFPEHSVLESSRLISVVRTREVETTSMQVAESQHTPSAEARLQSVMDDWRAETPTPIRSEVHKRLKPHLNSFPRRRNMAKQKRTERREFDQAMIERISLAIETVRERRSGVKLEPGRMRDDVRIDLPTWRKEVRKEFTDATDEIVKRVRREVYKFNDRKSIQSGGRSPES
ncbi:MAG: hypothetical protein ACREBC_30200, partial [Pyrinomonadaceae bacterium]